MRKALRGRRLILVFIWPAIGAGCLALPDGSNAQSVPSKEAFLNAVVPQLIDTLPSSSGTVMSSSAQTGATRRPTFHYLLGSDARPCGFIKYNYEEWLKYDLKEVVPITTLDELAGKCYHDRRHASWRQDSLPGAFCVNAAESDSILSVTSLISDKKLTKHQQRLIQRRTRAWLRLPRADRTIYEVSKPEFTDDGQYAMIEMIVRGGAGYSGEYTSLFRRTGADQWVLIGRSTNWVTAGQGGL